MKIEPRGKYAGVKVHLEGEEGEMFLKFLHHPDNEPISLKVVQFATTLGKKINSLVKEHPNLLKERTEKEIETALLKEKKEAEKKLEKLHHGKKWNE